MEVSALSALALSSLIALGDASSVEAWDTIDNYQLPAIAGLWVQQIKDDNGDMCQEFYNFGKNGKLTTVSRTEKTEGNYIFKRTDEFNLPLLAVHTTKDNNEKDCQGQQIDQTGHTMGIFVKLDSRHNPKTMWWCSDSNGNECLASLQRVLP